MKKITQQEVIDLLKTGKVDEELMWVDSFDRVANTATVAPYGRGYLGTTAATHTADTKVTISPTFPRYVIKRAVNDTIRAMGATIFAVNNTSFTYNAAITTYAFANLNIDNILTIMWQEIGPSKEWIPVRRWSFDSFAAFSICFLVIVSNIYLIFSTNTY